MTGQVQEMSEYKEETHSPISAGVRECTIHIGESILKNLCFKKFLVTRHDMNLPF